MPAGKQQADSYPERASARCSQREGVLAGEQVLEDRVLGVEAILGLIEDDASGPVEDLGGHLFAPVGRQAVHDLASSAWARSESFTW